MWITEDFLHAQKMVKININFTSFSYIWQFVLKEIDVLLLFQLQYMFFIHLLLSDTSSIDTKHMNNYNLLFHVIAFNEISEKTLHDT